DPESTYGQHTPQPEPPRLESLLENGQHKTTNKWGDRHGQCEADDASCWFHFCLLHRKSLIHRATLKHQRTSKTYTAKCSPTRMGILGDRRKAYEYLDGPRGWLRRSAVVFLPFSLPVQRLR